MVIGYCVCFYIANTFTIIHKVHKLIKIIIMSNKKCINNSSENNKKIPFKNSLKIERRVPLSYNIFCYRYFISLNVAVTGR